MFWDGENLTESPTHIYVSEECIKDCTKITRANFIKKYGLDSKIYHACRKYVVEKKIDGDIL